MTSPIKRVLKRHLLPEVLHEGEVAPEWLLTGHDGEEYASSANWSVLIFYPKDDTPTCKSQLAAFNRLHEEFSAENCALFGINSGTQASHAAFAQQLDLRFPLLVDTKGLVAKQYQALLKLPLVGNRVLRTVYLINPSRTIRLANRGNPNPEIVLRSIIALKQASSKLM